MPRDQDATYAWPATEAAAPQPRRAGTPGRTTLTSRLPPSAASIARAVVAQLQAADAAQALTGPDALAAAARGTAGGGGPLPFLAEIQRSFGHHDVSGVTAHVGGAAAEASQALGAHAYASGDAVAFARAPDIRLAAHEAAHVVQQRGGVRLSGGVGRAGDEHERHADEVAELVARGASAASTLDRYAHRGASGGPAVQRTEDDAVAPRATPDEALHATLFERGSDGAWPTAVPAADGARLSLRRGRGSLGASGALRVAPALVVAGAHAPRGDAATPPAPADRDAPVPAGIEDPGRAAARVASAAVEARLAAVAVPATGGNMYVKDGGWAYRAHTHARGSDAAAAHDAFMHQDNPLGLTGPQLQRWRIFQFVLGEGDTSAINAYDDQLVTIGAGFSARSGGAGRVYHRMPAPFHQRLFDHGIQLEADESFTVLDSARRVVERGDNALRVVQADQRRLGLLASLAQSTEQMTEGDQTMAARDWMLRAQMTEATASIPEVVLGWPLPLAKVAIKVHHWQGAIGWHQLVAWAGSPPSSGTMLSRARDQIWRLHHQPSDGAFSLVAIEARFTQRARQAGLGAIAWTAHPPR